MTVMGLAVRPGRSVPASTTPTGRGRPRDSGWRAGAHGARVRGDFGKAMAAHHGRGAAVLLAPDPHQRRPSGPEHAACRSLLRSGVNRRADSSRPRNTWPHDRYDSRRRSSFRSAVIARDSPVRWPAVPGLASLRRSRHRACRSVFINTTGERVQFRGADSSQDRSTPRSAACIRSRVNLRAAGSRPWVPPICKERIWTKPDGAGKRKPVDAGSTVRSS